MSITLCWVSRRPKRACKFVSRLEVLGWGNDESVSGCSLTRKVAMRELIKASVTWSAWSGRDSSESTGCGWAGLSTMMAHSWLPMFGSRWSSERPGEGSGSGWLKRIGSSSSDELAKAPLEVAGGGAGGGVSLCWHWAWLSWLEDWQQHLQWHCELLSGVELPWQERQDPNCYQSSSAESPCGWLQHIFLNVTVCSPDECQTQLG